MSIVRNTIFALLSGIEQDLRSFVRDHVTDDPFTTDELLVARGRAARDTIAVDEGDWQSLVGYTDLSQLLDVMDRSRAVLSAASGVPQGKLKIGVQQMRTLVPIRHRIAHSRPTEPEDLASVMDVGERAPKDLQPFKFTELQAVRAELAASPGYPLTIDIPEYWIVDSDRLDHNLPPAEWDDTGFIGRSKDRQNLLRLLSAPHPVVTVTGEGGVGKTALTVRCLYDLLDSEMALDAIVWTSAKAARLTPNGVRDVIGAMRTEVDILSAVATRFGDGIKEKELPDLISAVLEIMSEFRVLLVIDNLETLDRDALRPLFGAIPTGSKLLTTSRVGIGEFEARYAVQPLDSRDASDLMRRTAHLFNVGDLYRLEDERMSEYVRGLFLSPLAIRWFVQSYSQGRSAKELLDRKRSLDDLLRFCFQNLYETLTIEQTQVLRMLVAIGKPLSEVQIALLGGYDDVEILRGGLQYLYSSNLLLRTPDAWGGSDAPLWTVSEFARNYIITRDPQVATERLRLRPQYTALIGARDSARVAVEGNAFKARAIHVTTTDEATVLRSLREAQRASYRNEHAAALRHVETAARLLPDFYEVWRVAGQVRDAAGDVIGADEAFQHAIDLADGKSEPLLVFYAAFLIRQREFEEAHQLLQDAASKADAALELVTMHAWAQTLTGRIRDALETYGSVHAELFELGGRARSQYVTQFLETLRRACELEIARGLPRDALQHAMRGLAVAGEAIRAGMLDQRLAQGAQECFDEACRALARDCSGARWRELRSVAEPLIRNVDLKSGRRMGLDQLLGSCGEELNDEFLNRLTRPDESPDPSKSGVVKAFPVQRGYGFIAGEDGTDYFFPRSELSGVSWSSASVGGLTVTFEPSEPEEPGKSPRARHVRPMRTNADVLASSDRDV